MEFERKQIADSRDRRVFIGGSDARIIMGDDETALLRLWREKRGEAVRARLKRASITIDYFPRFSFRGVRSRTPGATAVLVDEYDAGGFQGATDRELILRPMHSTRVFLQTNADFAGFIVAEFNAGLLENLLYL